MNGMWGLLSDVWVFHEAWLPVVECTRMPVWGCESIMRCFCKPFLLTLFLMSWLSHVQNCPAYGETYGHVWKSEDHIIFEDYILFLKSIYHNIRVYSIYRAFFTSASRFSCDSATRSWSRPFRTTLVIPRGAICCVAEASLCSAPRRIRASTTLSHPSSSHTQYAFASLVDTLHLPISLLSPW